MSPRHLLLEILEASLRAVEGEACVAAALRDLDAPSVAVCAVGKAAASMTRGAYRALGQRIRSALVVTKDGHADPALSRLPDVRVIESAHPVPDERSLQAGAELERWISTLSDELHPVILVSGGSSSLVESLQPGVTLGALRDLNHRGLAAGWDIGRLNAERAKLSRLKGGGVSRLLAGRPALALFISDVPDDDPAVIGSGFAGPEGQRQDRVRRIIVATLDVATRRAAEFAQAQGLRVRRRTDRFAGEAAAVATGFVEALRDCDEDVLIWGGESVVTLPARSGRGGRSQHLALTAASKLHARDGVTLLAVGTDGTDGPTADAGAIVDAGTIARAQIGGVDVDRALRDFDAGVALEAAGDLVHTGPTGTNVGDLLIGVRWSATGISDPSAARVL